MVRLNDLHPEEAHSMRAAAQLGAGIEPGPWITPPPLKEMKVALLTTSGMHRRDDRPFKPVDYGYRLIPDDVDPADLVLSHMSPNFDRSAFQNDPNVMLPLDRLHELAEAGEIAGVSRWHFAFCGAMPLAEGLEPAAREAARLLREDGVNAIAMAPV